MDPALVEVLALAAGVFFLSGVTQSVTGFGGAVVAIPLLTLMIDPVTAVVAATVMSLGLSGWAGVREREHLDRPIAARMVVAGVLGMPLGLVLLLRLGDSALQVLMAGAILIALGVIGFGVRVPHGPATTWSTGVLSGTLLAATGMNGPPLIVGLQAAGLRPRVFRATLQVVFVAQDAVVLTAFVLAGQLSAQELELAAVGVLLSPLGWIAGDRLFSRVPARAFRWVLVAGLLGCALVLVLSALDH